MFEYKLLTTVAPDSVLNEAANVLGEFGWELVAFLPSHNKLIFKRPRTADPTEEEPTSTVQPA